MVGITFNITEVVLPFTRRLLLSDEVGQGLPLHMLPRRLSRLRDIGVCVCLILVCSEASNVLLQCLNACQQRLNVLVLWLWGRGGGRVRAAGVHAGGNGGGGSILPGHMG